MGRNLWMSVDEMGMEEKPQKPNLKTQTSNLKMYSRVDLHVHSTASDGRKTPAEVVALASARKIKLIALTDHDTTHGYAEAKAKGGSPKVRPEPKPAPAPQPVAAEPAGPNRSEGATR